MLADLVNGADVGMVQSRRSPSFASKTLERLQVPGKLVRQKLQRDKPPQLSVFGLVNDTHAAAAQFFDNAVMRDVLVDHKRRNFQWPYVRASPPRSQRRFF